MSRFLKVTILVIVICLSLFISSAVFADTCSGSCGGTSLGPITCPPDCCHVDCGPPATISC